MNLTPETLTASAVSTAVQVTTREAPGIVGIILEPTDGAIRIGSSGVTTSTGTIVNAGERCVIESKHPGQWYMVATTGTVDVRRTLLKGTR